jgi:glutathione synthase
VHLLFIIDPLATLKPRKDSSLDLMVAACRRGHQVSIVESENISLLRGMPTAYATELTVDDTVLRSDVATSVAKEVGEPSWKAMKEFDAVFVRKDPPFDANYLALTYILEAAESSTQFVNSPSGLRTVSEKLYAARFWRHTPSTLVTWQFEQAARFAKDFNEVVLKPSFLGSGTGVFRSSRSDDNFRGYFDLILGMRGGGPVIVQEYLAQGAEGDTRVMLLRGKPVAALGRRPAPGEFRANIAVGGEPFGVQLTREQEQISVDLGAELAKLGIVFAGIDFIGDRLIEINVTSPTLIQELRRVSGFDMSARILDSIGA